MRFIFHSIISLSPDTVVAGARPAAVRVPPATPGPAAQALRRCQQAARRPISQKLTPARTGCAWYQLRGSRTAEWHSAR